VGSLITALAAIGALVFTSQSLRSTQRQIGLSEQGQLTDRFGKAVEQLGSDKLDVRLGGIYALERLARDSARDHPTVMEVLAAFVRDHAPLTACPSKPDTPTHLATDVQATLTVIGRDAAHAKLGDRLDLTLTCLFRVNLTGADLSGADLSGADLGEATLGRANLSNANLSNANLTEADLTGADLTGADLSIAHGIRVHLGYAHLSGADLTVAKLRTSDLRRANLSGAHLGAADLTDVILHGADLTRADLGDANLSGADLGEANLGEANLVGANLTRADVTGAIGIPASPSVPSAPGPTR
jgi:uncharacterized protein YjbI with pentapeptide repeats